MKALTPSLALLAFAAGPAAADISAAELWAAWQAGAEAANATVTAEVSEGPDGLTLRNFEFRQDQGGGETIQRVDEIVLTETGGAVEIAPSQPYSIVTEVADESGVQGTIEFLASYEGLSVTATGDPENVAYDYAADGFQIVPGEITAVEGPAPQIVMSITGGSAEGTYEVSGTGEDLQISSDGSLGPMTLEADFSAPEGEAGRLKMTVELGPSRATSAGSAAEIQEIFSGEATDVDGDVSGTIAYDSLTYDFQFDEPGNSFRLAGSNAGGTAEVGFGASGLVYDLAAQDVVVQVTGSQMPFPLDLTAASTGFELVLPLVPAPEPSDLALVIDYAELQMSDQLWMMVDPAGALPRDPATLRVDLTGTALLTRPLMSQDPAPTPPGELRSLSLNDMVIAAAGAELSGEGAVEFQPGQFPPVPVGSVSLTLVGLNGLLDRLTGAGLLPMEQAGMVRAMSGMFGRPGAEPDTLESTIDFLPDGRITANGMQIR